MDAVNGPKIDRALAERLRAALRRVAHRVRRRRVGTALGLVGLVACAAAAAAVAWCIVSGIALPRLLVPLGWWLLGAAGAAAAVALLRPVSPYWVAREIDRRLGLQDRAAAALAVVDGTVRSRLSDAVAADALAALESDPERLDAAFPGLPTPRLVPLARLAAALVVAVLALVLLYDLVPKDGVIPFGPGGEDAREMPVGEATLPTDEADDADPLQEPGEPDEPSVEEASDGPAPPPEPEPPAEPETPAAPGARLSVVMSGEEFEPTDTVLALVSTWPTDALERPRGYRLLLAIDGTIVDPGESLALSPEPTQGVHVPLILNHLDGASESLQPGEHEVVALLEPEGGGEVIRSEPARYRIRGDEGGGGGGGDDDDGGGGGAQPPPPEPPSAPPPPPTPPPPPPAAPDEPEAGDDAPGAPPDEEPVTLPEETEIKIVVPLVGAGDEVEKLGPRLVLSPSGGRERAPTRVPLEEALPEARRRAERAVDRAGVRAADRDLVRRYFERLLRLSRGEPR